jgi:hypothetical protein
VIVRDGDVDCIVNIFTQCYNELTPYHCTLIPYLVTGIDRNLILRYI